jgi:hypothetical protein
MAREDKPKTELQVKMDAAAEVAAAELTKLLKPLTPAERKGAEVVIGWWKANYMKAGHKRLGRIIKAQ